MSLELGLGYLIWTVYIFTLVYAAIFCLNQLFLLIKYFQKAQDEVGSAKLPSAVPDLPVVTIQLPIFNEKYVITRLIDTVTKLDYPKEKLEIQILDDSTDETFEIAQQKSMEYRSLGFDIYCLHREDRTGFKAGALKEGLKLAKGEFIAIFDADFLPSSDFLMKNLQSFSHSDTGVVQSRWEHINQKDSLLTEVQAFQLNVHFTIEQKGRYQAGYFLQFNGTAGMWRKSCIEDAGGWETDTLTEDLDLSYRAQLKGWKIKYLEHVTAPAELPAEIYGLKSQQFRWMKGGAETARKLLPKVWAADINLVQKVQATLHLLSSSIFIVIFLMGILSVALLFIKDSLLADTSLLGVFKLSLLSIILVYFVANVQVAWPKENYIHMIIKFIFLFPVFLCLSMSLAFHNSLAVIQGFVGKKTPFNRTPKYGTTTNYNYLKKTSYFSRRTDWILIGEVVLCLVFLWAIYYGWSHDRSGFIIFHAMLAYGYMSLIYYAVKSKI
jgi:cellulose synthase/poly-beta-1,6-N-acetylglucosamine synthase-like glycosyltransferase